MILDTAFTITSKMKTTAANILHATPYRVQELAKHCAAGAPPAFVQPGRPHHN